MASLAKKWLSLTKSKSCNTSAAPTEQQISQVLVVDDSTNEDENSTPDCNTMETDDDSSRMNHQPAADTSSVENKNSNLCDNELSATTATNKSANNNNKKRNGEHKVGGQHDDQIEHGRPALIKSLMRRQSRAINSTLAVKLKMLYVLMYLLSLTVCLVHAGFWTFYFPNFLKPSGYNEISGIIKKFESDINSTKDAFADIQYFWGLMQEMDNVDENLIYPEESVCSEVFPLFRDIAIEYAHIDYELFIKPMEEYHKYLIEFRSENYPEGAKSRTILPREWEQNLYKTELELKIKWHNKLTTDPKYREKREKMVNIWKSVKRSLDTSLPCVYLRYSYRQMAEDINQQALEWNLQGMVTALNMVESAYKRIDKFKESDKKAIKQIDEAIEKEERLAIKS